jgi:hypothetical protein
MKFSSLRKIKIQSAMHADLQYCLRFARNNAYSAYLCAAALPPETRAKALPVVALAAELAQIAAKVSEATLAQMRFAWWREALASKAVHGHPVLEALKSVDVSFEALVDEAEAAWPHPPPPLSPALEAALDDARWKKNIALARKHPGPLLPLRLLLS